MFDWFQKRKLKREWRLVATLSGQYKWTGPKGRDAGSDTVYYYLYENGVGQRKCDWKGTGQLAEDMEYEYKRRWRDEACSSHKVYLGKIVPWLNGAYDPDIPSFATIKAKEFKDALRGSK